MGRDGTGKAGTARRGALRDGVEWLALNGRARIGVDRRGRDWTGVAGVAFSGLERRSAEGIGWQGAAWNGPARSGAEGNGKAGDATSGCARSGMERQGQERLALSGWMGKARLERRGPAPHGSARRGVARRRWKLNQGLAEMLALLFWGRMITFAILLTGPSMDAPLAYSVRHLQTVAVNTVGLDVINSVTGEVVPAIAPWATALAANDVAFWAAFPQAREFAGRMFSANRIKGVERIEGVSSGHCSGVLALEVAKQLGATRILLLGCDMRGTHYFGPYAHQKLKNTTDPRRKIHMQQFAQWGKRNPGIEVINCTPGSALKCFPFGELPS